MNKAFLLIVMTALIAGSCMAPVNTFQTMPVGSGDSIALSGYVYSLPRTLFRIEADITLTRTIRGPFYRFAEKYLGIPDAPQQSSVEWRLSGIRLETISESDPSSYYVIRTISGSPDLSEFMKLEREGLILDVNTPADVPGMAYRAGKTQDPVRFRDLSIHPNVELATDTLYKTILTDSTFIRVPVLRNQLIAKTIDEKAREAADLIFKLRKRRFHMISANYDFMPQGVAMEHALEKLDELEKEYLSLFIGKTITEHKTLTYFVTPDATRSEEQIELFEFSRSNGVVRSPAADSRVISLTIVKEHKTALLKGSSISLTGQPLTNEIYYRVPDMARINVLYGSEVLFQERIPVYQYGAILRLPVTE